ncbi:MAG: antitoxin [Candidatus Bathyarchaeota archaeon]|nr:antitoxin [Candidatus Bathyarchaeota archaeon]
MSDVIAIRVPKELKKELQQLNPDYAEDMRAYLEQMVKRKKLAKVLAEVTVFRQELYKKIGNTTPSADIIREDRDHGH